MCSMPLPFESTPHLESIHDRAIEPMKRHGLSHGFQGTLSQARHLEKQELRKTSLLPPSAETTSSLVKLTALNDATLLCREKQHREAWCSTRARVPCSPPVPIPQHHCHDGRKHDACKSVSPRESPCWDDVSWMSKFAPGSKKHSFLLECRTKSVADTRKEVFDSPRNSEDQSNEPHDGGVFQMDDL
ncbi:hypothetical protein CCR75_009636 [Bremia lactucae]|uniref:Uncharacterized protein n=1 Tax=Bremia lactucae TaxID=4779 RepID=A0A976FSS4_BRELC|nr:hypothetical protein CCR75_009636 [Bremia lactucae]